ncbi:MAG: orotidine-5'-phosphate decarboxylase [Candidatus Nealsonbacteria bacterium]
MGVQMEAKDRIIVALDTNDPEKAAILARDLSPHVGGFKLGLQFINAGLRLMVAPQSINEAIANLEAIRLLFAFIKGKIFWDIKLNDISNTVAGASKEIAEIGVKMFNVHASAGTEAIKLAVENRGNSLVLGVTVLTSIDEDECRSIFGDTPGSKVGQFARMLQQSGADGLICSPEELELLGRYSLFDDFLKVIPGIRPQWAVIGDQKRITTPEKAIRLGADYLVIGRPITSPPAEVGSPVDAVKRIVDEIDKVVNIPR